MADDSEISFGDLFKDDGTLAGILRQLNDVLAIVEELNKTVKDENVTKWLETVKKDSDKYKVAIASATSLAEQLVSLEQKLIELRLDASKKVKKLSVLIKEKNRNQELEAQIESKLSGSYARNKLELQKYLNEYKAISAEDENSVRRKAELAKKISQLSGSIMVTNKELKAMTTNYLGLTETEKKAYEAAERQTVANNAATNSMKKRVQAEERYKELTKKQGDVDYTAMLEAMNKAIERRIQLETEALMLEDGQYKAELSSAEIIQKRIDLKNQLRSVEAEIAALQTNEGRDLAILNAKAAMKKQRLDTEAQIIQARTAEGKQLAEDEERLKRINIENERNAKLAVAVEGSYEYNKILLEKQKDALANINFEDKEHLKYAMAEIAATQTLIKEAELWNEAVIKQANEQAKLNALEDISYEAKLRNSKELEIELKYKEGLIDAQSKLNAMQNLAKETVVQSVVPENSDGTTAHRSLIEEKKLTEELAEAYRKVEEAKGEAAFVGTQAYKDQIKAENDLRQAKLANVSGYKQEEFAAEGFISKLNTEKMTYNQLDALYKQVEMSMKNVADTGSKEYEQYIRILDEVTKKLNRMERQMGITSNRMSSRQREWDGLTNSVYQLTRELPNLAVRADTFFLAISNNIPIFIDELKRAKNEVGSLAGAWAKAGMAFLKSFPLAVLLLVLSRWSDMVKIFDSLFSTLEDGTLKSGAFYRKLEGYVKNASSSIVKQVYYVRMLSEEWKKLDSVEQRQEFLSKYREELDKTGIAIKDINSAEKALNENTGVIVEAYIARMKAAAAASLAEENYKKAIEAAFKVESRASKILGRDVDEQELRRMFAEKYGITDIKQIMSGNFQVTKEMLAKMISDYRQALGVTNVDMTWDREAGKLYATASAKGALFAGGLPKEFKQLVEQYNSMKSDGIVTVTKSIAEWLAVANESGDGSAKLRNAIREMDKSFAQGDQAVQKSNLYFEEYTNGIYEAGAAVSDLQKKLNQLDLKSLKALNQSLADLMNNPAYERGGVTIGQPVFKIVKDKEGKETVEEPIEDRVVKSSFDKQRLTDSQKVQEQIKEWQNVIDELNTLYAKANQEDKITIFGFIKRLENAILNEAKSLSDSLTQTDREENAAMARVYADNLNMRLEAIKEGNDKEMAAMLTFVGLESAAETNARLEGIINGSTEELALRKKALRAAMNAEIAENATQELRLQKSVAAIRAKYALEEERMVREHVIRINTYRKQQLENENEAELSLTLDYYSRRRQIQQIELENELLENAELIENGQIKREDIIRKHLKAQENLWKEHRNAVLSSQKSMWDVVEELAQTDSYEQLAAQLNKYDIELEQTKLQQQEIIDLQIPQELERIAIERANLVKQLEDQTDLTDAEIKLINKQIEGLDDEALKYEALSKEVTDYIQLLTRLNEKRKAKAEADLNLRNFEKTQEIESIGFYSQFQVGERQGSAFELEQERKLLEYRRDNAEALGYSEKEIELINAQLADTIRKERELKGWQGTISAVANHGLAGLIQLQAKDANGQTIKDEKTGQPVMKDLSSDQYDTLNTVLDSVRGNLYGVIQAYIDVAQAAYDAAQAQVDAARTVYEAELEARANGYANDVEGAKRELALEKRKAKQKEQILKQAQKTQERINTLQQISSLITGSAQILETFGAYPVIAAVLLASMWGMFAMAKIQAAQLANQSSTYGGGGFEVAVGGSHASGHDIKTGIKTKSGSQMVIEGGEGVGVFSRKAVTKYGDIIPNLVDSINSGTYGDVGNSQGSLDRLSPAATYSHMDFESAEPLVRTEYAKEIMTMQPMTNATDLSAIEGMLRMIVKQQDNQQIVLSDGSIMERKGNRTTITRRG